MFQCNRNIPVHLQQKDRNYAISWEGYAYRVFGFSGSTVSPFSDFQKRGENVNSASYCEFLFKFRDAIRGKCPGQQARSVLRHHDKARPHTAQAENSTTTVGTS
jgi:hypothetical protein